MERCLFLASAGLFLAAARAIVCSGNQQAGAKAEFSDCFTCKSIQAGNRNDCAASEMGLHFSDAGRSRKPDCSKGGM